MFSAGAAALSGGPHAAIDPFFSLPRNDTDCPVNIITPNGDIDMTRLFESLCRLGDALYANNDWKASHHFF